jgi:hypothetical protein
MCAFYTRVCESERMSQVPCLPPHHSSLCVSRHSASPFLAVFIPSLAEHPRRRPHLCRVLCVYVCVAVMCVCVCVAVHGVCVLNSVPP